MHCSTTSKVQDVHSLPESGITGAVPGAVVALLKCGVTIVTEAIWRQGVAVVRPDNQSNYGMDNSLGRSYTR